MTLLVILTDPYSFDGYKLSRSIKSTGTGGSGLAQIPMPTLMISIIMILMTLL